MSKKITIDFNHAQFEKHQQQFEHYESCKKAISKEVNSLLDEPIQIKDFTNCVWEFYEALQEQKKSTNNLNLSPIKLAEVLERDVTRLKVMETEILRLNPTKPEADNYKIFAETPDEIDRYNICNKAINVIDEFSKYNIQKNVHFTHAYSGLIYFDLIEYKMKPNIDFIKNGR
jgi:hypothetical protein